MNYDDRQKLMLRVFGATEWRECFTRYKDAEEKTRRWLYNTYINSVAWRIKKAGRKEIDGDQCQGRLCFRVDCLEVHHRSYERLGDERMEDLITLCERCHRKEHGTTSFYEDAVVVPGLPERA